MCLRRRRKAMVLHPGTPSTVLHLREVDFAELLFVLSFRYSASWNFLYSFLLCSYATLDLQ